MTRRQRRRVLLTVSKTIALTVFGVACMAIPFGIALAGNIAGIR
jgi:hypothetical protein